jgi:predicted RNA binding protein YcfA (HicA-like mRNA interferase family)
MSRIPSLSSREVVQALRKGGFLDAPKRGKGSHIAMVKRGSGLPRLVIIPERKVLPKGILKGNFGAGRIVKRRISLLIITLSITLAGYLSWTDGSPQEIACPIS